MRVAAYQFGVCGDVSENLRAIRGAVDQAAAGQADLLVLPECALTGYPPRDIPGAAAVDAAAVLEAQRQLQVLSDQTGVSLIAGAVCPENGRYYNRALVLRPGFSPAHYDKRALWGWDQENFTPGREKGVFDICGLRVGVRICFEVRFPEYFRELYREKADLNVVLFYDVSDHDDQDRYDLIRGHLRTRAVENVCPLLSVNAVAPFQTAPTCLIDASGRLRAEQLRNKEGLLLYDFEKTLPDFGEKGRLYFSDQLTDIR